MDRCKVAPASPPVGSVALASLPVGSVALASPPVGSVGQASLPVNPVGQVSNPVRIASLQPPYSMLRIVGKRWTFFLRPKACQGPQTSTQRCSTVNS